MESATDTNFTSYREWYATLCLCGTLVLLAACGPKPPPTPPPPGVSVAAVIEREITDFDEFTGRTESPEYVEIRPRVSGYIRNVALKEGKEVRKGELLFVIDPRPYQAVLDKALADLARAKAQADLSSAQAARAETLLASKVLSREDYDERVNAKRGADAGIRSAEAAVEAARLDVAYTRITSPIDGRVSRAEITEGNLVSGVNAGAANASLLTTVVSLDPMYVYFDGSEQDYLKYTSMASRGERPSSRDFPNPIEMGLANDDGYPRKGHMDFVDNRINPNTGTIRARAVFDNKDRTLTPGNGETTSPSR